MANTDELTYSGLQTKDFNTLLSEIQANIQEIYGKNGEQINFDSNTPDGNFTNILAELGTVIRELITEVYNSCDPTKCSGAVQDSRYQINYLTRNVGTYTQQTVAITANKTVTLQGLDGSYYEPDASAYAISDDNGNIWYLIDTSTVFPGTSYLQFRAKEIGQVIPTIGTITNQVTVVEGITNVINNVGYTSLGTTEESDANFRARRERSVANNSGNNIDAIVGNLLSLEGVDAVNSHINITNETDETGTTAHTMWIVVEGGANTDIAEIIYGNMAGCGTRGQVTIPLMTLGLQTININFDRPTIKPLYIKFDLQLLVDLIEISQQGIKEYIANNLSYNIGENAETSKPTEVAADAVVSDGGGAYVLNLKISSGGTATAEVVGTGITSASVVSSTFQDVVGDTTDTYVFRFLDNSWTLNGNIIEISDYGITYEGVPADEDLINIDFVAGTWTDVIDAETIADKFVTDPNKIYINPIEQG